MLFLVKRVAAAPHTNTINNESLYFRGKMTNRMYDLVNVLYCRRFREFHFSAYVVSCQSGGQQPPTTSDSNLLKLL